MKTTFQTLAFLLILAVSIFTGCKKDTDSPVTEPPPPVNESEIMTTFRLTFTDSAGTAPSVTAQFRDPDGDGGNPPAQFDTVKLSANTTYLAYITILDETKTPADTISKEVKEEANDHLFFFTPGAGINETIIILDLDTNPTPLPLGLQTKWKTGSASSGTTRIVLRHQPGVKNGNYTPGETDIDITFQTQIQ
jgi:hypothetical protein